MFHRKACSKHIFCVGIGRNIMAEWSTKNKKQNKAHITRHLVHTGPTGKRRAQHSREYQMACRFWGLQWELERGSLRLIRTGAPLETQVWKGLRKMQSVGDKSSIKYENDLREKDYRKQSETADFFEKNKHAVVEIVSLHWRAQLLDDKLAKIINDGME